MYEDYMQNLLGQRINPFQDTYCPGYGAYTMPMYTNNSNQEIEECYPEIYKMVYPMVKKACMECTKPITKDTIDKMVSDIYSNIEAENVINLNINLENNVGTENRDLKKEVKKDEVPTVENRNTPRNYLLNDLIRILLIRELYSF